MNICVYLLNLRYLRAKNTFETALAKKQKKLRIHEFLTNYLLFGFNS
jgi:hypothetical protein